MTSSQNDVLKQVEQLTNISPSNESTDRAISKTREALLAMAQDDSPIAAHRPVERGYWKLALGGGVAAALSVLAYIVSVTPGAVAFAEVQEQIRQVRNVTYDFVSGPDEKRISTHHIVSGNRHRVDWPGNTIIHAPDDKTTLRLKHTERQAIFSRDNSEQPRADTDVYMWLTTIAESSVKKLGKQTIDGKAVIGFEVPELGEGQRVPLKVWVDPQTRLPFKIVASGNRVLQNFVFDVEVPEGTFDQTVPAGYFVENRYKELQKPLDIGAEKLKKVAALVTDLSRNAQQTMEAFLILAKAGKTDLVQQLLTEPKSDDLRELDGFEKLELIKIWQAKSAALGITTLNIADRGKHHAIVFTVELTNGVWLIDDLDMESSQRITKEEERFREEYPDAKATVIDPVK